MRAPPDASRRPPGAVPGAAVEFPKGSGGHSGGSTDITAANRLQEHAERLAWRAYVRTLALQEAEPVTALFRNAVYSIWQQAFYAVAGAA